MTRGDRPIWVVQRETGVTFCDAPHPVRLGHNAQYSSSSPRERMNAIMDGRKGYLCPGNQEHGYPCWVVFNRLTDAEDIYDTRGVAVRACDRLNAQESK